MKKKIYSILLLAFIVLLSFGCKKEIQPITNESESTVIKGATSAEEYIKKNDLKSLAYAYIYNIKEGLNSYVQTIEGNLKAKVLFVNYNIEFTSQIIKKGSTFFSKDHSESTLKKLDSEYYLVGDEKILFSDDLKNYAVYDLVEFRKKDITPDQYALTGYVFTDESILSAELLKNENGVVIVKYILDNELATELSRKAMYYTGELSEYPTFSKVEVTIEMTTEIVPISIEVHTIYDAKRPVLGSATVDHSFHSTFTQINEEVEIPNESFYLEKMGQNVEEVVIKERNTVKDELLKSVTSHDFKTGINIDGNLDVTIPSLATALDLTISTSVIFDTTRLSGEELYSVFQMYAKLEGNDEMSAVIGLVKSFAGDKLGEYEKLLDDFKGIEVICPGNGRLILTPYNDDGKYYASFELKIVDILDIIISKINLYNMLNNQNDESVKFEKRDGTSEDTYVVDIILSEETINSYKEKIENFIANDESGMVGIIFDYKEFDSIKISVNVEKGLATSLDASINYFKNSTPEESSKLVGLRLDVSSLNYDFSGSDAFVSIYNDYNAAMPIKEELSFYMSHTYLSRQYITDAQAAIAKYNELSDSQKAFIESYIVDSINSNIEKVKALLPFIAVYYKIDFEHINNTSLYNVIVEYNKVRTYSSLLSDILSEEELSRLTSLSSLVDYSKADVAVFKLLSTDESTWNLTEEEIDDFYAIVKIGELDSTVMFTMMIKIMMVNPALDYNTFASKIINMENN